jgi:hypothetical protein
MGCPVTLRSKCHKSPQSMDSGIILASPDLPRNQVSWILRVGPKSPLLDNVCLCFFTNRNTFVLSLRHGGHQASPSVATNLQEGPSINPSFHSKVILFLKRTHLFKGMLFALT